MAGETVFKLTGMEIPTVKADAAIKRLSTQTGEYNNILVTLQYKENNQTLRTNTKLFRGGKSLEKVDSMKKCKEQEEILECLADNIKDQTPDNSLPFFICQHLILGWT